MAILMILNALAIVAGVYFMPSKEPYIRPLATISLLIGLNSFAWMILILPTIK